MKSPIKTTYIAQRFSGKWLPVCRRDSPRTARLWACMKHPDATIRVIRATFQVIKPYEVR
jgi:hypothetical protein